MSDNKVREVVTVCLSWQKWTETSASFDVVGATAFHSCVVVDLWRSLSEWRLLLSECVFLASKQINVLEHPPYSPDLASQ
jgi:hypothetical protein